MSGFVAVVPRDEDRRFLAMLAATIAAGVEANNSFSDPEDAAAYALRVAAAILARIGEKS